MCRPHLWHIVHEQKLREMIVDAGALQAFGGGEEVLLRQRLAADLLVMRGAEQGEAAICSAR